MYQPLPLYSPSQNTNVNQATTSLNIYVTIIMQKTLKCEMYKNIYGFTLENLI